MPAATQPKIKDAQPVIPLRDAIPSRTTPIVTYAILALNIVAFIIELTVGLNNREFFETFAFIPAQFTDNLAAESFTLLTAMFLHAGPLHIAGNMLYLWIFGDNVEDALGHAQYAAFYLGGGVAATAAHLATNPDSMIPTVGASGAIAAVLGAYLVLYPRAQVMTLIPFGFFFFVETLPAVLVLGFWFVLQLFEGLTTLGVEDAAGGVAFWAHIGGFVFGVAVAQFITRPRQQYGLRRD